MSCSTVTISGRLCKSALRSQGRQATASAEGPEISWDHSPQTSHGQTTLWVQRVQARAMSETKFPNGWLPPPPPPPLPPSPPPPAPPRWTTQLNIALLKETYFIHSSIKRKMQLLTLLPSVRANRHCKISSQDAPRLLNMRKSRPASGFHNLNETYDKWLVDRVYSVCT